MGRLFIEHLDLKDELKIVCKECKIALSYVFEVLSYNYQCTNGKAYLVTLV